MQNPSNYCSEARDAQNLKNTYLMKEMNIMKWVILWMLWAQAAMNPFQEQSEMLIMAHKSKAGEKNPETDRK